MLDYAVNNKMPLVLASTGHSDEQLKKINEAATVIPVFKASNMSLGVNLLASLAQNATKFLGEDYDVEIVETHHNLKMDSPSGTALTLAEAITSVRDNLKPQYGRHGANCRRQKNEIGIHAIRGGTVVGKHDVLFLGGGEQVKLSHEAENKEVFVRGALRAAYFILDKPAGMYNMTSILGNDYAVTTVGADYGISLVHLPSVSFDSFVKLLDDIKKADVLLDMISQNFNSDGSAAVSFSLFDYDLEKVKGFIPSDILYTAAVGAAKISVEGAGMEHKSGVALDVLSILKKAGATVYAITTSETKISCAINAESVDKSISALKGFYGI